MGRHVNYNKERRHIKSTLRRTIMQSFEMTASDGLVLSSYKFIPKKTKGVFVLLHGSIEHAKR